MRWLSQAAAHNPAHPSAVQQLLAKLRLTTIPATPTLVTVGGAFSYPPSDLHSFPASCSHGHAENFTEMIVEHVMGYVSINA